jgi:predicted metalloprotease with PDZ domain
VCEGITTYYGDFLLFRSGVFNEDQYLKTFADRLQKHFDNFGRYNLSVAASSFDTWLDGYTKGVANRKTSIYDEGCLLAFITDIFIRKHSNNKYSLDDAMRYLYEEFGLKHKGYSEQDYKGVIEYFANKSFDKIYNDQINGTADYQPILTEAMDYIGCELVMNATAQYHEHSLGIKVSEANGICKVSAVYPDSVADKAGIALNDELIAVNNMQIKTDAVSSNFTDWCNYFLSEKNASILLTIASSRILKEVTLIPKSANYYSIVSMQKQKDASVTQKDNFEWWSKNKF